MIFKKIKWNLTIPFRVMKTENFFDEFKETRESLKRVATIDGEAFRQLPEFNKNKKRVRIISPNGRFCYVPIGLKSDMEYIKKMDKDYQEKYPSDDPTMAYSVRVVR